MAPVKKALLAASLAAATSTVAYFEGRSLVGYLDPVGIPTICYGHTATAHLGQELSAEECERLLAEDLGWALGAVDRHLPNAPAMTRAALGSFVYNVGTGAFERSTLLRKARSGDWVGACNELSRWVYAGGRELRGLVRRREAERELCLEGLKYEPNHLGAGPFAYRIGLGAEASNRSDWGSAYPVAVSAGQGTSLSRVDRKSSAVAF